MFFNMKNIGFVIILILVSSCVHDVKKDTAQVSEKLPTKEYISKSGKITLNLNTEWNITETDTNLIKGQDSTNHQLKITIAQPTDDIFNYLQTLIEQSNGTVLQNITETEINELPALTTKFKTDSNNIINSVWCVYNGIEYINLSINASALNFKDEVALSFISGIQINERSDEIILPIVEESIMHLKPKVYPEKTLKLFADNFSTTAVLKDQWVENAVYAIEIIKQNEKDYKALISAETTNKNTMQLLDSLVQMAGIKDWNQEYQIIVSAVLSVTVLESVEELSLIDENTADFKMSKDIIKSIIEQGNISEADLKYSYEHWEAMNTFVALFE